MLRMRVNYDGYIQIKGSFRTKILERKAQFYSLGKHQALTFVQIDQRKNSSMQIITR